MICYFNLDINRFCYLIYLLRVAISLSPSSLFNDLIGGIFNCSFEILLKYAESLL